MYTKKHSSSHKPHANALTATDRFISTVGKIILSVKIEIRAWSLTVSARAAGYLSL
jgi:hypothetical protein